MIKAIEQAIQLYSDIKIVVFTGGECFMLKNDLFKAIEFCTQKGLQSRCVTNAYWAKRSEVAERYAKKLVQVGINEINISTGLDHQEWINEDTVINAVKHLTQQNIFTLVTVEKDNDNSNCLNQILDNPLIQNLTLNHKDIFLIQSNAWMPFYEDSDQRENIDSDIINKGCDQIFENLVITPKKEVSACCGLTLEHIPEMKLGNIKNLECYKDMQQDDFLKIWIKVEGPLKIIEQLLGENNEKLINIQHQCQACAILHKDEEIIGKLINNYSEYIVPVLHKFNMSKISQ
jgi:hypothetical protein